MQDVIHAEQRMIRRHRLADTIAASPALQQRSCCTYTRAHSATSVTPALCFPAPPSTFVLSEYMSYFLHV